MEEESSEYTSSYEDESEEEEPKLKYQRLGNKEKRTLNIRRCWCCRIVTKERSQGHLHEDKREVSGRFDLILLNLPKALGTHQGVIYILDFNGNENGRLDSHPGFPVREIRYVGK